MAPGMRAPFTSPGLALLLAGGSPPLPAHVGVCTCLLDVFVLLVGATVSLAQGLPWFRFAERTRSLGKVGDVVWLSPDTVPFSPAAGPCHGPEVPYPI